MRQIIKSWGFERYEYFGWSLEENCGEKQLRVYFASDAPVAQLDRALPSGGGASDEKHLGATEVMRFAPTPST